MAPPPNKNTVGYYGALAPNAPLRPLLAKEAQELSGKDNRAGKIPALRKVAGIERAKEKLRAATRSWAACLSRVFEVEPESQVNPLADLNDAIDDPAGEELTPA